MGHGARISRIAAWVPIAFVGCGGLLVFGCGESEQADRGQPFMEGANPIVSDICDLRFEQECMRFSETVEQCRLERLTTVGAQARFNANDAACEATLFGLLDCHLEHPCDDVLDLSSEVPEPDYPCPTLREAFLESCRDVLGS
ncbi:MAG: hypothetical protein HKN97_11470 [Myxococcales bacterium]|nr:hypothetical protein [Myxococcales bacterium]